MQNNYMNLSVNLHFIYCSVENKLKKIEFYFTKANNKFYLIVYADRRIGNVYYVRSF